MKIVPLKEGDFLVNKNKEFALLHEVATEVGLKMAVQPFLISVNNEYILLDAGVGWEQGGKQILPELLKKERIEPEQISKILLSHLHKDHVNGLGRIEGNKFIPNFPNAEIYLQRREYDYALQQNESPSFDLRLLIKLQDFHNIRWMEEDSGKIENYVRFEVTGGHTPFHQVFWIQDEEEIAFYGADNLPTMGYLNYEIAYKTDYDGKKAKEQRHQWALDAKEYGWKILLYHDMYTPVYF